MKNPVLAPADPVEAATTLLVRRACRDDLETLACFQVAMALESEGRVLDLENLRQGVRRILDEPSLGTYWVVEDTEKNALAGMCMVTYEWSDWHNRFYWWFQSVYVDPAWRGQGCLRMLMARVAEAARLADAQELRLYVESENTRAVQAYKKLGFTFGHYLVMQQEP